jgi:hypothetical protein
MCGDGEVGVGGGKSIQTTGAEVEAHLPFGRGRQNQLAATIPSTPAPLPFLLSVWLVSGGSHCAGKKMTQFQRTEVKELSPGN